MNSYYIQVNNKYLSAKHKTSYHAIYMGTMTHILQVLKKHKIDSTYLTEILQNKEYIEKRKFRMQEFGYLDVYCHCVSTTSIEFNEQLREYAVYEIEQIDKIKKKINFIKNLETVRARLKQDIKDLSLSNEPIEFEHKRKRYSRTEFQSTKLTQEQMFKELFLFFDSIINDFKDVKDEKLVIQKVENNYNESNKYYLVYGEKNDQVGFIEKDYPDGLTKNFSEALIIEGHFDIDYELKKLSSYGFTNLKAIDFSINLNLDAISQIERNTKDNFIDTIVYSKEKELLQSQLNTQTTLPPKRFKV